MLDVVKLNTRAKHVTIPFLVPIAKAGTLRTPESVQGGNKKNRYNKLDYGYMVYGSARKSYLHMLDPIHNRGLRLWLGAFRTSPVEPLYVDAHEPNLGARHTKISLQYATKIKSLSNHPAHNAVFDNTHINLIDDRPSVIRTFGLRIKQFLSASNIDFC